MNLNEKQSDVIESIMYVIACQSPTITEEYGRMPQEVKIVRINSIHKLYEYWSIQVCFRHFLNQNTDNLILEMSLPNSGTQVLK